MNRARLNRCDLRPSRRVAGWLAVAAVLALSVLTASAQLHRLIHADAGSDAHVCAVTMAHGGFCDTAPALIVVELPAPMFQSAVRIPAAVWCEAPEHQHPPPRGPPRRKA